MDGSGNALPAGIRTISLDQFVFHPGINVPLSRRQNRPTPSPSPRRRSSQPLQIGPVLFESWYDRIRTAPLPGRIRLLKGPETAPYCSLEPLWYKDKTLREWIDAIEMAKHDLSDNPIAVSFRPMDYIERLEELFHKNQRQRWLAHVVRQRWCRRVWMKKTQCNVDMIDMAPIQDKDAIFMTDTKHRQIYRFHRRDVFTNLLTNICMSDEMLPSPRTPTNPWTNAKLTMPQTMTLCQQIVADYAKRGLCPPVLFSAFWEARFNIRKFHDDNSALLSQHAIRSYFKDLHEENLPTVLDTMINLLDACRILYSIVALRRWLRQTPQTASHREWLTMTRDYTLYINLHVQARQHWYSEDHIYADVRRLYNRTTIPDPASPRLQILRNAAAAAAAPAAAPAQAQPPTLYSILTYPLFFNAPPRLIQDASGSVMSDDQAIQIIRDALFRM